MTFFQYLSNISQPPIPISISVNFILLIFLIYFNRREIKKFLASIDKRTWLILLLILVLGLSLRLFLPPKQHIIFFDEPGYMLIAKNLLAEGRVGIEWDNPSSIGWPFILAISFGIFGSGSATAIYTSLIFGALTIFNIFLLGMVIFKNKDIALFSVFLFAFLPLHIRWSASAGNNVISLFFITAALFFCFLYLDSKKYSLLWLALAAVFFAAQFRPENYILPALFLVAILIFDRLPSVENWLKFSIPWMATFLLALPNLTQVLGYQTSANWIESDSARAMTGSNWSFYNLISNTLDHGGNLFNGNYEPLIFIFLFAVGFLYLVKKDFRKAMFFFIWYLCFYFIYFFSWLQTLGAGDRFYTTFYPVTALLAGVGIWIISQTISKRFNWNPVKTYFLAAGIIVFLFFSSVKNSSFLYAGIFEKWETDILETAKKEISPGCLIIARQTFPVQAITDFRTLTIEELLKRNLKIDDGQCVVFFHDISCDWPLRPGEIDWCAEMASVYRLSPLIIEYLPEQYGSGRYNFKKTKAYGFYQVLNKGERKSETVR